MMVLLLLLGEAEFGVQHVLWAHEVAERRGEGCVHFGFSSFYGLSWLVVELLRRIGWFEVRVEGRRARSVAC